MEMLNDGILSIDETEGEEISLTAEGPQLTEEERLRIESEKEEGDDEDVKRIDLFASEDNEGDPLNSLLLSEDGITTLFMKKGGRVPLKDGTNKPAIQGGGPNYLGKQPEVKVPRYWKSSPDHPDTELAYITEPEKKVLIALNMHGGLEDGKPNKGPEGVISLQGDMGSIGGGGNTGGGNNDRPTMADVAGPTTTTTSTSDTGDHSRFDVGSGYYGETVTDPGGSGDTITNEPDVAYDDPILSMVDKSKIPGTEEYLKAEKTDYVLMPSKKLKLSKGVRPAAIVPLDTKKYYDRLDKYIAENTGLLSAYNIEKTLTNAIIDQIPVIGKFLPEQYPSVNINFENIGKYEVPGSDLGFYDPDEYPEFYEDGPEEDDRDGPVIEQIIAANQVIEERDETDIFDIWDRIKAKQAQRALLVEKGIIQDNSEIPQTKEAMMLNSGGLANLFRVKTQ